VKTKIENWRQPHAVKKRSLLSIGTAIVEFSDRKQNQSE